MNYKNKPLLFAKTDIPRIEAELKKEIPKILEEFNMYFKCKEPLKIEYNFDEHIKGYTCSGDLYFGDKLIKHYDEFDLLVYDLYRMELDKDLEIINSNRDEEEENEQD